MIKTVQRLIQRFGFEIRKVDNFHLKPNREVHIQLGRFPLVVHSRSPLSVQYTKQPGYGSEFGRLATALAQKYPALSVIDIGANIGDTAAIVKNAVDAPILCIEGDPYCFSILQRNIAQFGNVTAYRQFLGDRDETISARLEKSTWNTTIIPDQEGETAVVQLLRLDSFLKEHALSEPYKLLKIDTEGFDVKIIRGASGLIDAVKPAIYFEYNRHNMDEIGEKGVDTLYWLKEKGYDDILFFEDNGQFILSGSLSDKRLIDQLHHWVGISTNIYYFDLIVFHKDDKDIAEQFIKSESKR